MVIGNTTTGASSIFNYDDDVNQHVTEAAVVAWNQINTKDDNNGT